jgi:hypothetical protein
MLFGGRKPQRERGLPRGRTRRSRKKIKVFEIQKGDQDRQEENEEIKIAKKRTRRSREMAYESLKLTCDLYLRVPLHRLAATLPRVIIVSG